MDMKTYLRQASPEQRKALAQAVSSSVGYFYSIAGGHKRPGTKLCQSLVAAESKLTLSELRPDIWPDATPSNTTPASAAVRHRATDPEPGEGHAGRQPSSPHQILDTVPERAVVTPLPPKGIV